MIDEADSQKLEEELKTNNYLQEEVINISKSIAPWIPYIGLTLAGISIAKFSYTRYLRHGQANEDAKDTQDKPINKSKENYATKGGAQSATVPSGE